MPGALGNSMETTGQDSQPGGKKCQRRLGNKQTNTAGEADYTGLFQVIVKTLTFALKDMETHWKYLSRGMTMTQIQEDHSVQVESSQYGAKVPAERLVGSFLVFQPYFLPLASSNFMFQPHQTSSFFHCAFIHISAFVTSVISTQNASCIAPSANLCLIYATLILCNILDTSSSREPLPFQAYDGVPRLL